MNYDIIIINLVNKEIYRSKIRINNLGYFIKLVKRTQKANK